MERVKEGVRPRGSAWGDDAGQPMCSPCFRVSGRRCYYYPVKPQTIPDEPGLNDNQTDFSFVHELPTPQRATTPETQPERGHETPPETEKVTPSADRPAVTDPLGEILTLEVSGVTARARKKRAKDKSRGYVRVETRLDKKSYAAVRRLAKKRKISVSSWIAACTTRAASEGGNIGRQEGDAQQ